MRVQGSFSRVYEGLLGGSWLVIGGVISPLMWLISIVTLVMSLLVTSHEPPSSIEQDHYSTPNPTYPR